MTIEHGTFPPVSKQQVPLLCSPPFYPFSPSQPIPLLLRCPLLSLSLFLLHYHFSPHTLFLTIQIRYCISPPSISTPAIWTPHSQHHPPPTLFFLIRFRPDSVFQGHCDCLFSFIARPQRRVALHSIYVFWTTILIWPCFIQIGQFSFSKTNLKCELQKFPLANRRCLGRVESVALRSACKWRVASSRAQRRQTALESLTVFRLPVGPFCWSTKFASPTLSTSRSIDITMKPPNQYWLSITAIMPKDKTTTTTTRKGGKERVQRRKKGMLAPRPAQLALSGLRIDPNTFQTPTPPSVVCPPTCSSPTTTVTRSARRTPVSHSVSQLVPASCILLTITAGQVGKMLGDKWKALTESERKPYDEKAATDKKRYEEEKAKYQAVSS